MPANEKKLLTVFAKNPVAGQVKTRLGPAYSPREAAELAEAMLEDTLEKVAGARACRVQLAMAPPEALAEVRSRYPDVAVVAQEGEGLAERMERHFAAGFAQAPDALLVLIGSDAPHLPVERIEAAFAALESGVRLVLGPDEGGGYYLIGLRGGVVPELFRDVVMSTADMCARTVQIARDLGLSFHILEPGYDLDRPADLERLARELAASDPDSRTLFHPRRLAALLQTLHD